ncbi:MAG: GNAT family protein [Pseudohongiellaceae bacterium]
MTRENAASACSIRPLKDADVAFYLAHFARHREESGRGDYHFMPFEPGDSNGPRGPNLDKLAQQLTEPGWQRYWIAVDELQQRIIGHVNLKGSPLRSALHRCELGIGIERAWRGQGLGLRLMTVAIDFAQQSPSIAWIDLGVFAHNHNAVSLYRKLGFKELITIEDRFRVEGAAIADIMMTLNLK